MALIQEKEFSEAKIVSFADISVSTLNLWLAKAWNAEDMLNRIL